MAFNNFDSQTILAKVEVTEGLDPVPTPAANALEVFNWSCNPSSDTVSRTPNKSFFVNDEVSYPNKKYDISFDMYLTGAGAAAVTAGTPPPYDPIMLACSHAGVGTATVDYQYLPTSTGSTTLTFYYYQGGVLYKVHACRGSITDEMKIGEVRMLKVKMTGVYASPVDSAIGGSPDFSSFRSPLIDSDPNSVCNVHGTEVHGRSLTFDQNNTNEFYETTKSKTIINSDRKSKANLVVGLETLALFDAYGLWESEAGGVVYWETGTVTGDIVRLSMPNAQIATPSISGGGANVTEQAIEIIPHPTPAGSDDEYVYIIK